MFGVVIILIWLLQSTNADVAHDITIQFSNEIVNNTTTLKCVNDTTFVLRDDIPIMMYINYASNILVHECFSASNIKYKFKVAKFEKNSSYSVATVTTFMEGEINCYFLMNKGIISIQPQYTYPKDNETYTRVACSFKIVIKPLKHFNVKINGNVLKKDVVKTSNEVDAISKYYFVPKERIDITCSTSSAHALAVKCPQYNYSSDKEFVNDINFQMVLEAHHNNTHIDCVLHTSGTETVIRVYMILKKNYDEKDIIRINSMALRNVEKKTNTVKYIYYGDMPRVTCPSTSQFAITEHEEYEDKGVCEINGKNTSIILTKKQDPDNAIYINGLDDGKILLHIKSNSNRTREIHYSYTDNDVLEFKFWYGTAHKDIIWTLKGFNNSEKYKNSFNYSMKEEYDLGKVILKPEKDNMQTVIVFHYQEKDVTPDKEGNTNFEPTEGEITTTEKYTNDPEQSSQVMKFLGANYKGLIGGVLVIIFVLIIIYLVILFKKRRALALKGEQSDVDYVNLENNKPDAQFPKLNDSVYLQPPKESEDYAVPVDVNSDASPYSVPYKPTLEELYAKPTPKHNRNKKSDDDITYAEIGFTKPQNIYSKVNQPNAQCIYAEVHPVKGKDMYRVVKPKAERDEYVNDFSGSAYVNGHSQRDNVEPAYCEVSDLRK